LLPARASQKIGACRSAEISAPALLEFGLADAMNCEFSSMFQAFLHHIRFRHLSLCRCHAAASPTRRLAKRQKPAQTKCF
jgi:hypothetical protein